MSGQGASGPGARRDLARNGAFFLGAFGTTLGLLGATLAGLGIVASWAPDAARNAPDWVFAVVIILLLIGVVVAWPGLDWLANRYPRGGTIFMGGVATVMMVVGGVAVTTTAWDLPGWCAWAGGLILLLGARLAHIGGGTTPLEWAALRTERVRAVESRLDPMLSGVVALLSVVGLVAALIQGAIDAAVLVAIVAVAAVGWWLAVRDCDSRPAPLGDPAPCTRRGAACPYDGTGDPSAARGSRKCATRGRRRLASRQVGARPGWPPGDRLREMACRR